MEPDPPPAPVYRPVRAPITPRSKAELRALEQAWRWGFLPAPPSPPPYRGGR